MKRTPLKRKRGIIKGRTKRSPQGQQALDAFTKRWLGKPCWGCGDMRGPFEKHHIAGRDGCLEHDDERDLAHLCQMCHAVHHDNGIKTWHGRTVRVRLTKDDVLRLKRDRDPEFWDLDWLRKISGNLRLGEELI